MNTFIRSRMRLKPVSEVRYEENMAIIRTLYPNTKQMKQKSWTSEYSRVERFALIGKNGAKSSFELFDIANKCHCGCGQWDYDSGVEMAAKNREKDFYITILERKNIAETEEGRRKLTYEMHPKFYELVDGSLDALLLINLGKQGGRVR